MIHIEHLSYEYTNGIQVLRDLNLSIKTGEFAAIIGQNGAGKTTLLKQFNGLLKPTKGKITVNGVDVCSAKTSSLAQHIGFLFQNPDHQIFCSTVFDEIAFGLKNLGKSQEYIDKHVRLAAENVGLSGHLGSDPFSLSKGQRQRIALASVLAMETEVIVLDEPTTGQDYQESIEIMEIIKLLNMSGKTIIFVTHDMELVSRYAKRVIILYKGQILEDGPAETVLGKTESLSLAKLHSPQIYLLARKFHKQGLFKNAYTVEDMFNEILLLTGGEKNACNG
ncbi:MAG: energy-coupling factor ABC transporter ATP-binding protein [Clostridia bacterium]|nr:energy-coupling factor ABC transporter ATP-binding protein [Clostridia bacterium]